MAFGETSSLQEIGTGDSRPMGARFSVSKSRHVFTGRCLEVYFYYEV